MANHYGYGNGGRFLFTRTALYLPTYLCYIVAIKRGYVAGKQHIVRNSQPEKKCFTTKRPLVWQKCRFGITLFGVQRYVKTSWQESQFECFGVCFCEYICVSVWVMFESVAV